MFLPKFEYLRPASLGEACGVLQKYGHRARLIAGGTDLLPRMKYGLIQPQVVVSLKGIPAKAPSVSEKGDLHLDALMTLAEVILSPVVRDKLPMLAEAALRVGSNQVRHMGTLGGNICLENRCLYYNQTHTNQFVEPCFKRKGAQCYLIPGGKKCWAAFMADTVPALISLGAIVNIRGPGKGSQLPLERFYTGDELRPFALSETEIVTEIVVPGQVPMTGSAFVKFSLRGGMEFAALNLAVVLVMDDDGVLCRKARITVGAISAAPVRMLKGEEALIGQSLSEDLFQHVADTVASAARPGLHHGNSATYLRECLKVKTREALELAAERLRRH